MYRIAHYVHHKNIDVGPWSGVSMHPIEHPIEHLEFMYASMLIHWVIGAHPIHMIFQGQAVTFASIVGHGGFEEIVIKDDVKISSYGNYWHSLHHRFFECNYGEPTVPFDHLFGTNYDGGFTRGARKDAGQETRYARELGWASRNYSPPERSISSAGFQLSPATSTPSSAAIVRSMRQTFINGSSLMTCPSNATATVCDQSSSPARPASASRICTCRSLTICLKLTNVFDILR